MTEPRHLLDGTAYRISRRVVLGQFLLRPCEETNKIFTFCLGLAALRAGVQVHAAVVLPDGWRGVVTDPKGHLPYFLHYLHMMVAVAMNRYTGNHENFW